MTEDPHPERTPQPPASIAELASVTQPNTPVDKFCDWVLGIYAHGEAPNAAAEKEFRILEDTLRRFNLYTVKDLLNMPVGQAMSLDKRNHRTTAQGKNETPRISTECKELFLEAIKEVSMAFKEQGRPIYTDQQRPGARARPMRSR